MSHGLAGRAGRTGPALTLEPRPQARRAVSRWSLLAPIHPTGPRHQLQRASSTQSISLDSIIMGIMGVLKCFRREELDHMQKQRKGPRGLVLARAVAGGRPCFDRTPPMPHSADLFGSDFQTQPPTQNIPVGISNCEGLFFILYYILLYTVIITKNSHFWDRQVLLGAPTSLVV